VTLRAMASIAPGHKPLAYSYVQMSARAQRNGNSLRRQMKVSKKYAADNGLELVEDFKLHAVFKGANVATATLGKLLKAIISGKIPTGSYLIVEAMDGLSPQEAPATRDDFLKLINAGITLVTLADRQVYEAGKTDTRQLFNSILRMSFAHEESVMKGRRVAAAWENKRANLASIKLTARCPAWLRLSADKTSFEVIKDRVKIVQRIFQESADGIGNYSIARRFFQQKIPTFRGAEYWPTSSIAKILSGRAVLGEFQPNVLANGKREPHGGPIPDYFPAVVCEDLFRRAENARAQRGGDGAGQKGRRGRRGSGISNLFSGIAHCAYCRSKMHYVNRGKAGAYLVCARRGLGCEKAGWRYDQFEASFLSFVQELDLEPIVRGEDEAERRHLDEAISALEERKSSLEGLREKIFQLLEQDGVGASYVGDKLRQCESDLSALQLGLDERRLERDSLRSEASRFYESQAQIKSLIERLRTRGDDEVYKLRAQISSRLASLVSVLLVAPLGFDRPTPDITTREHFEFKKWLERLLDWTKVDGHHRRYFSVHFKDGRYRNVFPNANYPFGAFEQIYVADDGVHRVDSTGVDSLFSPSVPEKQGFSATKGVLERIRAWAAGADVVSLAVRLKFEPSRPPRMTTAALGNASAKSVNLRLRLSQAKKRSTTQRRG
jgi:DNA invertase Pin-like site-specific DNA recombinase